VEEAHDGVMVAVQKEEAVDRVEYDMVIQEREVDTDDGAGGEVDEAHEAAEIGVAGVEAVALGEHHPAARVEAWIKDMRVDALKQPVASPSVSCTRGRPSCTREAFPSATLGEEPLANPLT
jgi:hypothetical protein